MSDEHDREHQVGDDAPADPFSSYDADAVHQASPDFPVLWELCRRLGTTGAYVTGLLRRARTTA